MYEWAVAAGTGEALRVSPVGVTDDETRARARMLEALGAVPDGVPACGWVTVMDYVPLTNGYDRYQTPVHVEGDAGCAIRAVRGSGLAGSLLSGSGSAPRPARARIYVLDGGRLRRLRRQRGLSQEKLADQAGVSLTAVARLERQARASCRGRTLARLAAVLGEDPGGLAPPAIARPCAYPGHAEA